MTARQRRDHLPLGRPSRGPSEHRHCRIELVVHIQHRQRGMERGVPRRRARRRMRQNPARSAVSRPSWKRKKKVRSKPLSGTTTNAPVGIENHCVRMRRGLLPRVRTGRSLQRDQLADRPQPPVLVDRHHRHGAGAVIRDHQEAFGRDRAPRSTGLLPWQSTWLSSVSSAGLPVDGEGADQVRPPCTQ